MISLDEAVKIAQVDLDVNTGYLSDVGAGFLALSSSATDLGYGWWIEYAPREFVERGEGTGDLAGGAGPYIVLKTTGQLWRPRMFSKKENHRFSPHWQWLLDFEQHALGVLRVAGVVHPTMKYTGNPDLSFLPAFKDLKEIPTELVSS